MRKINVNLAPERKLQLMVIAAVMTTAPRHIIAAVQMEGAAIKSDAWNVTLAALSIAFAALEGFALLQIESAQTRAQATDNASAARRLSVIKWLIYLSIPATFVLPVYAQSQHTTVNALLAGYPLVLLIQSALIVAAPMFVISGAATSASVLSAPEAQAPTVKISKPPKPESAPAMPPAPPSKELPPPTDETQAEPEQPASTGIDRERLAAMLRDNPAITSGALAEEFRVSAGRIRQTPEWKAAKEARS